jgi:bifunctional DNA-binding transcriptional regulator/antitoxin component of YhaV-PrlF toxin-antitoxin module
VATEVKRRPGITSVSRKHQITLPVDTLREAGLHPGDELRVTIDGRDPQVLTVTQDPLEKLIGSAPGLSATTDLEALRNEWSQ